MWASSMRGLEGLGEGVLFFGGCWEMGRCFLKMRLAVEGGGSGAARGVRAVVGALCLCREELYRRVHTLQDRARAEASRPREEAARQGWFAQQENSLAGEEVVNGGAFSLCAALGGLMQGAELSGRPSATPFCQRPRPE